MSDSVSNLRAYIEAKHLPDTDPGSKEEALQVQARTYLNAPTDYTSEETANVELYNNINEPSDSSLTTCPVDVVGGSRAILPTSASMVCRICQGNGNSHHEPLISPCNCKGSMAYVHLSCLERWLNQSSRTHCELCMFRFNSIRTQRYGMVESLKLWLRHPQNRPHFQSDLLIGSILTLVTIGLLSVCLLGVHYFVLELKKYGIPRMLTLVIIGSFLVVVFIGYMLTMYFLLRDQLQPWYRWWRRTVNIKLLLTPSMMLGKKKGHRFNHSEIEITCC